MPHLATPTLGCAFTSTLYPLIDAGSILEPLLKFGLGRFSRVPLSHLEPGNTLEEMQSDYA